MRTLLATTFVPLVVVGCGSTPVAPTAPQPSIAQRWASALNECNVDALVGLYHPEALFWPTTSPTLATRPEDTRRYYDAACKLVKAGGFKVEIAGEVFRVFGDSVVSAGEARFSFRTRDGQTQTGLGRFSLAARRVDGKWLIIEHHSSAVPAAPTR